MGRHQITLYRWAKQNFPDPLPEDCLLWLGGRTTNGYGRTRVDGRYDLAHRVAWSAWNGPIPEGLQIRHRCDVPACYNPLHLLSGTAKDNAADVLERGRLGKRAGPHPPTWAHPGGRCADPEAEAARRAKIGAAMQGNTRGLANIGANSPKARKNWPDPTRWSRDRDACVECGTSAKPHKSKGLCDPCYLRAYRAALSYDVRQKQVHQR